MKSTELRIGNLVNDEDGQPMYIAGLWPVGDGRYNFIDSAGNTGDVTRLLQPIPLTPEILEGAGFVNTRDGSHRVYNEFGNIFKLNCIDGDYEFTWGATPIKYVHQLQNLYFALTNQELTINL